MATQSYVAGMASLYRRKDSPFLWLKCRRGGRIVSESTGLRWGDPAEAREARSRRARAEVEERRGGRTRGDWSWVEPWLLVRYASRLPTLGVALKRWRPLAMFLEERGIFSPAALTRPACLDYVAWRAVARGGLRGCCLNTALADLETLGAIVDEAIRRDLASVNPARRLGIRKAERKQKPALTEADCRRVARELRKPRWEPWMRVAWAIGEAQGCRISETSFPLADVDFGRGTITFRKTKTVPFTTAMNPKLAPLLRRLAASGAQLTCVLPPNPSERFRDLFHSLGMDGVSFHSTRVTVISRLARAGVSQSQAMRFVGHASATVHRLYQRLGVEDLGACLRALSGSRKP